MENAYGKFILLMKLVVNTQSQGAMKTERVVCTAERLRTCGARCGEHNQACFKGHPCWEQSRSLCLLFLELLLTVIFIDNH